MTNLRFALDKYLSMRKGLGIQVRAPDPVGSPTSSPS